MLENLTAVVTTYRINWRSIIDFLISIKGSVAEHISESTSVILECWPKRASVKIEKENIFGCKEKTSSCNRLVHPHTHTHTHTREPHNHKLISTGYIYEIELDPFFQRRKEKKKKRKKYIYNPAAAQ
jgi:hypothetical protein